MKVFLGGTCNDSLWRDELIDKLECEYFNPVTNDWTEEAQEEEIKQRNECDFVLYVITPLMSGVYSIAELVHDSVTRPEKTLFCYLLSDQFNEFTEHQMKSLEMVKQMVKDDGARVFNDLDEIALFLNNVN